MDIFADCPYGVEDIIVRKMVASVAISPTGALVPFLDTAAIAYSGRYPFSHSGDTRSLDGAKLILFS